MTPTNTPTSKCCENCANLEYPAAHSLCSCHTPTTDSKNSSEKCPCGCHGDVIPQGECLPCCPIKNTTPNSSEDWEKRFDSMWPNQTTVREDLMALFGSEYRPHTATEAVILEQAENKRQHFKDFIRREIERKAKEEYERGRKDAVEFIRRNWVQAIVATKQEVMDMKSGEIIPIRDEGIYYVHESTLEAALETPS